MTRQKISKSLKDYYANGGINSRQGKHFTMSEEQKKKISESLKGEKAYWYGKKLPPEQAKKLKSFKPGNIPWNKGLGTISSENEKARKTKQARDWRKAVYERDDYACVFCRKRGGRLNADHIKPFAYHPELRYELSNGRTLCEPCHKTTDTYGWKMYNNKAA